MFKLCNDASADSSNLNSGCFGVVQGMLKTVLIVLMRLFGQSNDSCKIMMQMSLSDGFCELQGKYKCSPRNSVNSCVVEDNVAS